jgi:hypothetical protein
VVVGLSGAKSPWMSLTLDAFENNRLLPSLLRGAREGDFFHSCILTSHGRGESYGSVVLTLLRTQFRRLAVRRGRKCAIIAVAHSLLIIGYHLQRRGCTYTDLGSNYFDRLHAEGLKRYLVKRLENLGHSVILQPLRV